MVRTVTVLVAPSAAIALGAAPADAAITKIHLSLSASGDILVRGTLTRTSTLGAQGEATCPGQDPASCRSRPVNLDLRGGADNARSGRTFRGIAINGGLQDFRDPFDQCRSPRQMLPSAIYQTVPFPRSFMVSCKHGTLTRLITNTKAFSEPGTEQISGDTSLKMSIMVSRLGPLRGYRC